jgi:hypothetical protein
MTIQKLVEAAEELQIPLAENTKTPAKNLRSAALSLQKKTPSKMRLEDYPAELARDVTAVWQDRGVQKAFEQALYKSNLRPPGNPK